MQINRGPLIFPTTGFDRPLALLPGVAAYAAALRRPLVVLHVLRKRYEDFSKRRLAETIGELNGSAPAEIVTIEPKQRMRQLTEIARNQGGLIVTLPTRRSFVGRLLSMLSDYEQLIIEGPLPVLALPAAGMTATAPRRVLFPIDLAPRSEPALDEVITFCADHGAELHLLHVFGGDTLLAAEVNQSERSAARTPAELYKIDRSRMQELADRVSARTVAVTLQQAEGRAHSAILGYVQQHEIDLIAMATHGPRTNEDIWYGTTTARVIRKAAVPVLALRS